ncbi:MAG: carboxymuconolactone decarboxylase family protein [Actinomycetota bacterium]
MTDQTDTSSGQRRTSPHHEVTTAANQDRRHQGLAVLDEIDGEAGHAVIESLAEIAPDLAHHIAAFAFGDIYARPGIEPRQRQLVTIGSLTALGGCEPQLRVHIGAALNVGLSPTEIVEAIIHTTVYCGFPKAINAIFVAKDVFAERELLPVGQ